MFCAQYESALMGIAHFPAVTCSLFF